MECGLIIAYSSLYSQKKIMNCYEPNSVLSALHIKMAITQLITSVKVLEFVRNVDRVTHCTHLHKCSSHCNAVHRVASRKTLNVDM